MLVLGGGGTVFITYFMVASTIIQFLYGQLHIHHPKNHHCLGHWDIWKHFPGFFFFSLVAINYFNNDYLAASQGASAWQLLIRLPTTTRADWLMSLLHCRWPPAAGPTASPARQRARGDSDCSFPNCFVQPFSVAWPPPLAALNVNPQLPGSSQAMPWYHQNQPPELHLPGRTLLERGTDTWRPVMKIRGSFKSLLRHY